MRAEALEAGTKLGPYEILSPLGAGGMGEVYLARDSRLGREVAIKALPEHLAADPDRLSRFEREARTLASLNHPNIGGIHGVEEQDGKKYLVLEYVEGQTLAERLDAGPLPIDDAIDICSQIAAGMEAAHDAGVIHRDLKPANVKITSDGKVKVLDFGLAKVTEASSSSGLHDAETVTSPVRHSPTMPGVILGTAAYMSPEQARGRAIDKRTDMWSFGVLLYECLVGTNPFVGETVSDSVGAILHKQVDFARLPNATPFVVRHLLGRCLQRDKNKRLQSAGDARIELEEALQEDESATGAQSSASRRGSWVWPVLALLLAVALGASLLRPTSKGQAPTKMIPDPVVTELVQLTSLPGMQTDPSISPDGRMLLFVARDGNDSDIFLQRVGGENAINLTADSAADDDDPAFSPDGERIAFRSQREGGGLFVMGATGESPRRVSDEGFDPEWSPDGKSLVYTTEDVEGPYSRISVANLWTLSLQTREKHRLTRQDSVAPAFSPSGKLIAFWAAIGGVRDIFIVGVDGGDPQAITNDVATDWNPFFSPDGRTLFFITDRSGSPDLWRIPINPETGRATGTMRPVTAGVTAIDQATITADGEHIVFMAPLTSSWIERYAFDAEKERVVGKREAVYASTSMLLQFDVTSDGKRLVFRTDAPREDLVVMNIDGTGRRRLMDDAYRDRGPNWTPDGEWLLFYSNRGGLYDLWRIRPDGTGLHQLTATTGPDVTGTFLSPDQKMLAGTVSSSTGGSLVFYDLNEPIASIDEPIPVPEPTSFVLNPLRFSPDGRWIAGYSDFDVGVYDSQSDRYTQLKAPDGKPMQVSQYSGMDWIDSKRLITWDETRATAFVCDVESNTCRPLDGIEGPCDSRVVEGGKAIIVNRLRAESDIWMLRLEQREETGAASGRASSSAPGE